MVYGAVSGESVTYTNATQADLHYLKHSLSGPLTRIERALTALLPRPQVVKFNRDAILRSDPLTRAQVQEIRLRNKTVTVNEVRAIEDELPFPDPEFDRPGVPGESDLSVAEAVQKVYLGVGSVLTPDEARKIVNDMGGDLAIPGPIELPADAPEVTP